MKQLKRLFGILTKNLWLKVLSVILAFVVWILVARITNPVSSNSFSNVRVTLLNTEVLEAAGKVYQVLDNSDIIKVTVRAPQSVMSGITATNINAYADLSNISEDGTVPIVCSIDSAESVVIDHSTIKVNVEDKTSKYVNIVYEITGSVGEGCVQGKVVLDRNRIEVSGPQSDVDRVSYAKVVIDLDGALKTISADMEVFLCDADGKRIFSDNIVKQTDYVTTTVTVLSTKEVPIYSYVTGEPSDGYLFTGSLQVYPTHITIAGDTSVLNNISHIEITDPVDLEGATKDVLATFDLTKYLPANVSVEEPGFEGEVAVTAYVEKVAEKTVNVPLLRIGLTNIPDGYEAELVENETVPVHLSGLATELNAISSESLACTVDVSGNLPEEYEDGDIIAIPVRFTLSDHVKADPVFVHVILREK